MSESLVFDHVHLAAPDQALAGAWYMAHLGATPGASPERVLIGDRLWLIFYKAPDAAPSRRSVIDSIGFSVPDAAATIDRLVVAGASLVDAPGAMFGGLVGGMVEDPFGARLAILEDPQRLGFHHVRLRVPDPDTALAWYLEMFGGERTGFNGNVDALRYGPVWLFAERGDGAPSEGHAIDHLGWRTAHLDATAAELAAKNVVFTMTPRQFNEHVRISFVVGPAGTRIEVLQRAPVVV